MRPRWWILLVACGPACVGGGPEEEVGEVRGGLEAVTWTDAVGVAIDGNDLTKSIDRGWNAGAISAEVLSGDGFVEFTTGENTTAKMAGLSRGNDGVSYEDIDFAIYLQANGTVGVREGGLTRGKFGPYAAGDVFRVQVQGGVVTYWHNGGLLRASAATPSFPLLVDTSLRTPGATISGAVIETAPFWTALVGATADSNDLTRDTTAGGWLAGASSIARLAGDGYAAFTTGENTSSKMAGLSRGDGGVSYEDIDFAIYLQANGTVGVREGGLTRGKFGPYAAGDVFRVAVNAGVVTYARNGVVFYTSSGTPTFPLLLDTSLRTPGATILQAELVDTPSVVVFDNSDATFVWHWNCGCVDEPPFPPSWLDPSRAADQQTGLSSARGIQFFKQDPSVGMSTPGEFAFQGRSAPGGLAIAAAPSFVIPGNEDGYDRGVIPPLSKSPGDVVGPADDWRQRVLTAHFIDLSQSYGPSQTWFRDGIIGVRFPMADGVHYGFIELDYIPNDFNSWYAVYRPVRWGYSPIPDQPLVIPPP